MPHSTDVPSESGDVPMPPPLLRQQTSMEQAIAEFKPQATKLISRFVSQETPAPESLPARKLQGCFFVGHTSTDLDSIGSAIGAAELFSGVATRASGINTETEFALKYFQLDLPPLFKDALEKDGKLPNGSMRQVCLVDHNQSTQLAEAVDCNHIAGIIDHHALQSNTITTPGPIYINIQPWGSAATIVAQLFLDSQREIRPATAGVLLCAILSDTLNLESPTTTESDRLMVSLLSLIAEVKDANALATKLFQAKSLMIDRLTSHQLINGDLKTFQYTCSNFQGIIAWGTVESPGIVDTVGKDPEKLSDLQYELRAVKNERNAGLAFVSLVDIVNFKSVIIICGSDEMALAKKAFGGPVNGFLMETGRRVSRKADFIPPISKVLESGWEPPAQQQEAEEEKLEFGSVYVDHIEGQCVTRRHRPPTQQYDYEDEPEAGSFHSHNHGMRDEVVCV